MQFSRLLMSLAVLAVVAGCAGSAVGPSATPATTAGTSQSPSATVTIAPSTVPPTPISTLPTRIDVTLTDDLKIEPATMTVARGIPVTFMLTNAGALDHEFYLGDEQMQADHAAEMADMGGMMGHDEPNGVALAPGETKELTFTFEVTGEWIAGCHVSGHYEAGMRATINIVD